MKKQNQIWTAVTPQMHKKLKEYAQENQIASTRAKMIMYILYHFHPEELLEDYTFQTKTGKMINIKVSDTELKYIEKLAQKHNVSISRLLRNMVYTYFFTLEKEKRNGNLTNNVEDIASLE
ncbi:MAG: hypothetical protein PWP31_1437 [Clostridia bacterium]|nr:hypothetical protein [Clostridia bacterium]MDK2901356.1 hypothetical protein [Thermosediminibacterales bacterium]